MNTLLRYLFLLSLHPATSLVAIAIFLTFAYHTSIVLQLLLTFTVVLFYFVLGPRTRRNHHLWQSLALPCKSCPSERCAATLLTPDADGRNKIIVSFPSDESLEIMDHALAFMEGPSASSSSGSGKKEEHTTTRRVHPLSQCTALYVARTASDHGLFRLPLARVMLWLLGGLLQYSRGLLLQLLLRRRGSVVAVILQPPIRRRNGTSWCSLEDKGVFAAALKGGASIIPAVVSTKRSFSGPMEVTVAYGTPVTLSDEPNPIAIPMPNQVQALSKLFGVELQRLFTETSGGKNLSIKH